MLQEKMRWIYYSDLLEDELQQCRTEGRAVEPLESEVKKALAMAPGAEQEALARELVLRLEAQPFATAQHENEPTEYADLTQMLSQESRRLFPVDKAAIPEKLKGAWVGRLCGCLLGIPVENWTRGRIRGYLEETDAWPLETYMTGKASPAAREKYGVTDFDPGTPYDRWTTCWIEHIDGFPVDDDINYMMMALKVLGRYGRQFTSKDMAEAWLLGMPAFQACTSERVAYRNLLNGLLPPACASFGNPFREWIGAQIRGDVFGYVCPGNPQEAAHMAYRDAAVSHVKNGVYGEMFVAAVLSLCYCKEMDMAQIVRAALLQTPPKSRFNAAVEDVLERFERGDSYEATVEYIHTLYNEAYWFDWCHVLPNAMLVAANILYWQQDYSAAITHTVLCGFDTDCNGATVGSVIGLYRGFETIAPHWYNSIAPTVDSGIHGFASQTVDELVGMTQQLFPR